MDIGGVMRIPACGKRSSICIVGGGANVASGPAVVARPEAGFNPLVSRITIGPTLGVCLALGITHALLAQSSATSDDRRTLRSGGVERTYLLHLPASRPSGEPLPLILVFHGAGGRARGMVTHTRLTEEAGRRGYAVAYPFGLNRRWNDGRGAATSGNDVEFVRALLDSLGRELPVDSTRVYATGISNGAGLAYRLACDLPGKFAAIAPVAGGLPLALEERCAAARPVAVVIFQGDRDPLVPYGGGSGTVRPGGVLPAPRTAALFASLNRCAPSPTVALEPDTATDGTRTRRSAYAGCSGERGVTLYTIEGGGHTWPGGPSAGRAMGRSSRDLDATRTMLDFFDRHPGAVAGVSGR
jgi:polyhydroxybutyrate depolymerase